MIEFFVGKELSVGIVEVSAVNKKVVCSSIKAKENDALRRLEVWTFPYFWSATRIGDFQFSIYI